METELTKSIKKSLRNYKPSALSNMRTIRWAEEVTTKTGIVDFIRFEDIISKDNSYCSQDTCKSGEGHTFSQQSCKGCVHKRNSYEYGIKTTCFEVKISKSDFKSNNGHNFCGNENYYVVPIELYDKIKDLVPEDIGILAYYRENTIRVKKKCIPKELSAEDLSCLLYNALKKWVDGSWRAVVL